MRSKLSTLLMVVLTVLAQPARSAYCKEPLRAPNQQRAGQLGTRHDRAAEPGVSSRTAADDDAASLPPNHTMREIAALEEKCLGEVNRLRQAYGISRLVFDEELLEVARAYSRRMAEERFFSHEDPDGQTVRQRVNMAGIAWRMVGENLAYSTGYTNPVAASLRGWMESEPHKRNMLEAGFTHSAIGVWISSNGTVYFTEIFLRR